jgi:acyl-CoA synthetase (AMP-forming)/AMP-acid ligase II
LAPSFPVSELRHIINDSGAFLLLSSTKYAQHAHEVLQDGLESTPSFHQLDELEQGSVHNQEIELIGTSDAAGGGMMLYTSGTTARPKGVLLTTAALAAQAQSLLSAWNYTTQDHLMHVLPLHHIHGTVNAILTPLLAGSSIEFLYPFDAHLVWARLAAPFLPTRKHGLTNGSSTGTHHSASTPISFFTAVPTIWARLLQTYRTLTPEVQTAAKEAISRRHLRLNLSGSAALPTPTLDGWTALSGGNVLLERYGMTEVGMALSCGLDDSDRVVGSVGWPLPSVEARLWEEEADGPTGTGAVILPGEEIDPVTGKERQGEIQLRGPTIFREYWRNPAATVKEFTVDGWFKTGDIALRRTVPGAGEGRSGAWARGPAYFIQGRQSADIIKTGGEKVSALEIEREILSLPQVDECVVVGLPSETWGQKVVAVVVLSEEWKEGDKPWGVAEMRRALKERLVAYKIPQDLEVVGSIKRNAMGKVNKKELVPTVFGDVEKIRRRSISQREEKARLKKMLN